MTDDKLIVTDAPDGYVSKTKAEDVEAYLAEITKETHRIVGALGEDPDPVLVTFAMDVSRLIVQVSMISRELDEHGIHPLEVEWSSQVAPKPDSLDGLLAKLDAFFTGRGL